MPQVGDVGVIFELTIKNNGVGVDISAASTMEIYFEKPDGSTLQKTAVHTTDGTDFKMQYSSIAGDLDIEGWWLWQGRVVLGSGDWRTDVHRFPVKPNVPTLPT